MAGFSADKAKAGLHLPDDIVPVAMWAIGYPGFLEDLPDRLRAVELSERTRRPHKESFCRFTGAASRGRELTDDLRESNLYLPAFSTHWHWHSAYAEITQRV
jgi:hypothetical protein